MKKNNLPKIRPGHQSYLILNNVAKESNFGFLIRTANAFGAIPVIVGKKRYSRGGACAGTGRTPVFHFYYLHESIKFLKSKGCSICGIEITPDATPIQQIQFNQSTAFVIGNEGSGLSDVQKSFCDSFTYIPQYGDAVSLNLNVAAGIVLQRYASGAGYLECPREGEKFKFQPDSELNTRD